MKGWGLTEPRTEPGSLGHGDVCVGGRGGGAGGWWPVTESVRLV